MRAHYEAAARHPTAYYGQLARARLGLDQFALRHPPQELHGVAPELLRAADMLYAIGDRDFFVAFVTDLAASTGSNASRSPKRATMSSVSWRTCRSTAHALTPASRRSSPTCTARRRSTPAPPSQPRWRNPSDPVDRSAGGAPADGLAAVSALAH
jgi:hypothetical protein